MSRDMASNESFDAAVIGGGVMGSTIALWLARAGMRVVLFERRPSVCMEASGTNTGALMMQLVRAMLIPYAMRSREMWRTAADWLGRDVGFKENGGLTLAFSDAEATMLAGWMADRRAAGAPIEIIDGKRAREIEPGVTDAAVLASYCAIDGYADVTQTGLAYLRALKDAGVDVRTRTTVQGVERDGGGFTLRLADGQVRASRLALSGGVWIGGMSRWFGLDFPIDCRVNQVSVTERLPPIMKSSICVATGRLSLKQTKAGTVLIGGGWQGIGDPDRGGVELIPENLIGNLRLACHTVPSLRQARVVRTWLGVEARAPDYQPIVGRLPGVENAYVIGAIHAGYTCGPYISRLLAETMLEREPEMALSPLFDPARLLKPIPDFFANQAPPATVPARA